MKSFLALIDTFNARVGQITAFVLIPTVFCVFYEIIARFVFNSPTLWASELTIYLCAILYILGAAWTMQVDRHVKIDMLYSRFSPRGRRILDLVTFTFFTFYLVMLLWVGFRFAADSIGLRETSGTPWDPPIYPIKSIFVIGCVMLLLQGAAKFIRDLYFVKNGKEL
jgi:TRAP-type mannitol/chloroaromatic compound transport system permease small subunit